MVPASARPPSGPRRRSRGRLRLRSPGVAVAALVAAMLAGCGGADDPSVPSTSAPGRATTSTAGPEVGAPSTSPPDPGAGPGAGPEGDGTPAEGEVSGTALRNPEGTTVGTVLFEVVEGTTRVTVQLTDGGEPNAFHGLIIHANDDPTNGEGCEADPAEAAGTWFVSADGHLVDDSDAEGSHQGDLPNVWVMGDGRATAQSLTDRVVPSQLVGTAVVLHARPSNHNNVPVGDGPGQYTPNSERSRMTSETTGNTGFRIACGVVESGGGAAGSPVR